MSRMYRAVSCLEVDATLCEKECAFWRDVLYRSVDQPTDILEGCEDYFTHPGDVEV